MGVCGVSGVWWSPNFTIFENINQLIYQLTPHSVTTFGGKEIRPWQLREHINVFTLDPLSQQIPQNAHKIYAILISIICDFKIDLITYESVPIFTNLT